jgi:hypothetical protein
MKSIYPLFIVVFFQLFSSEIAFAQDTKSFASEQANSTEPIDITKIPDGWKKRVDFIFGAVWTQADKWVGAADKYNVAINTSSIIRIENKRKKTQWISDATILAGGLISTTTTGKFRKAQDQLIVNSTIQSQIIPKFFTAWKNSLITQLLPTYTYNNGVQGEMVSSAFSPGIIRTGLGFIYKPKSNFKIYFSPITASINTKLNKKFLLNESGYGVPANKTFRIGWGALANSEFNQIIKKKYNFKTKLELFTDYTRSPFTVIDVDWINSLTFPISKSLSLAILVNTRYYHFIQQDLQYMHTVGLSGSFNF